jgi:hypothetical protein
MYILVSLSLTLHSLTAEQHEKISLFILDNDDGEVVQNHILAFTHTSLNVIFIGMFITTTPPLTREKKKKYLRGGGGKLHEERTDTQNDEARKLRFHCRSEKGFCLPPKCSHTQ